MTAAAENVLGGILLGGKDAYWLVAGMLAPADFPNRWLSGVYEACARVADSAIDLDVVTVGAEVVRAGLGRDDELIAMAARTAGFANIRGWAELVKQDSVRRAFKAICTDGAKSGDLAETQAKISALLSGQPAVAKHASDACNRMWDGVIARYEGGEELTGLVTGYPLLDEWTGGLQPGRIYGIGARAKMGKTILAMNICANVACPPCDSHGEFVRPPKSVGIWSLEMSDEELMQRMTCGIAGIQSMRMQRPRLMEDSDFAKAQAATRRIKAASIWVSDKTDVGMDEIEAQARQMHASEAGLDLLCLDYLGLMRLAKADRHDLAIAQITRRYKIICKELKIAGILVFQLNRGSENGVAVRAPRPSDARDSGAIEQDLDAMLLLHRPSYYDPNAPKGLRLELALQRNGPTGLIHLNDELDCCRFTGGSHKWDDKTSARGGMDDDL